MFEYSGGVRVRGGDQLFLYIFFHIRPIQMNEVKGGQGMN